MFAKRYQYYDYCLPSAICGYNFPELWIFARSFPLELSTALSILHPSLPSPPPSNYYYFITDPPLARRSPNFSRPFLRYSIKQSGPIKRGGEGRGWEERMEKNFHRGEARFGRGLIDR